MYLVIFNDLMFGALITSGFYEVNHAFRDSKIICEMQIKETDLHCSRAHNRSEVLRIDFLSTSNEAVWRLSG